MFKKGEKAWQLRKKGGLAGKRLENANKYIEKHKEELTIEVLTDLANSKVYKAMKKAKGFNEIKGICLPIALRGMQDKTELLNSGRRIDIFQFIANVSPSPTRQGKEGNVVEKDLYVNEPDIKVNESNKANVSEIAPPDGGVAKIVGENVKVTDDIVSVQ